MRLYSFIVFIIGTFFSIPALARNYYLSNAGNDAASGLSMRDPWSTIMKLNTIMKDIKAGDSVFFKRGNVFYGTIEIQASGDIGNPIYLGDYDTGPKPVITGFTSLTSWKKLSNNLWEADCNSGPTLNLVTVQGQAIAMGRYPDKGNYLKVDSALSLTQISDLSLTRSNTNWTNAQLVIKTSEYTWDRCRITGQQGATILFTPSSGHEPIKGYGYFIQDDIRTLNVQNEWWYDSKNYRLLLYSVTDPSKLNVKAATADYASNSHYRHRITFNNIQFSGQDSIAIRSFGGEHITITNCDFNVIGIDALVIDQGYRVLVRGNTINHIHNTGIRIVYSKFSQLVGNTIQNCGLTPGMGLSNNQQMDGILAESSGDSIIIDSNTIKKIGYCGITFSGRYTQIRNNYIDSFCITVTDGGGIYTCCDNLAGRVVSNNVVSNGIGNHEATTYTENGGAVPIYLDDHTAGVTLLNNTVFNGNRYGIFLHNAHEITIIGNKIYNNAGAAAIGFAQDILGKQDPLRNITLSGNYIFARKDSKILELSSLSDDIKLMGAFDSNYYSRPNTGNIISYTVTDGINKTLFSGNYTLDQWKSTYGYDKTSSVVHHSADGLRFEFNNGKADKIIYLNKPWMDLKKKTRNGAVILKPYESMILIQK